MSPVEQIAHFVTHRRRAVFALLAACLLLAAILLAFRLRLDTEILNLLPPGFDSVETLKIYNRDFAQARELTFALYDETRQADLESFTEHFAEALGKEPWVARWLDRSPMEDENGRREVQAIALPLLFNLPPQEFAATLDQLRPEAMRNRLHRLRTELEAGSPRAAFLMEFDPLGIVFPALRPLNESFTVEQAQPLVSADGTLRLVMVMTSQPDTGPRACQALMREVDAFRKRVVETWKNGPAPEILVTGRTPYVAEMSRTMESDIFVTVLSSVLLVSVVFYIGFRQLKPLFAIMNILFLACIMAVALGALIFGTLNGITIGFCSILVGLGVDFGMLAYGGYRASRETGLGHEGAVVATLRHLALPVLFGALTTAAGYAALVVSGCPGFSQLGVLIGLGILLAAGLMLTLFFAHLGPRYQPARAVPLQGRSRTLVELIRERPRLFLGCTVALFAGMTLYAFAPVGRLPFDANPRSLEPKDSQAGYALRRIQEKMTPGGIEHVMVMIEAKTPQKFHDYWMRAQARWEAKRAAGEITSVSSPVAFALSPDLLKTNQRQLSTLPLDETAEAIRAGIEADGFNAESFAGAFATLDRLKEIAAGSPPPGWRQALPADSSWWFVLDKFFGQRDGVGFAYITPSFKIDSPAAREKIRDILQAPETPMRFTGWSYMLAELLPWAKSRLVLFTSVMLALNVLLLLILFRRIPPVLILILTLLLSIGAMVGTVKLLNIPLNLFNILGFPLVFCVGVDYGIHVLVALRENADAQAALKPIIKPLVLSTLTSMIGFGSLAPVHNPSLSGLGVICAIGAGWSLLATLFVIVPIALILPRR